MILTKKAKEMLKNQIESVIHHPLMSEIEPCLFCVYGDSIFTFQKNSLTDSFFEINFIPIDASTCIMESETIDQLLSIPFMYLRVILFDKDGNNPEVLINHCPKVAFDYNLN